MQGAPGGIRYSYSCGCVPGIREYLFNTQGYASAGLVSKRGLVSEGALLSEEGLVSK